MDSKERNAGDETVRRRNVSPVLVDVQLFHQNVHDQVLNEGKIVVAGVAALAGGVRVAVGAAVMALVHSPVVPGCASKHERRAIVIDGENSCLSLSHTSPYCPLSLAIFQEVTPLGESSVPWTKTATKPSASASKWNWDSVSI